MRKLPTLGLELIKKFEGLELKAYQDVVGIWTIGYGHTGPDVYPGMTITEFKAEQLLLQDLSVARSCVECFTKVQLSDNQFGALVSLVFNIGSGAYRKSTLLKLLNEKKYKAASEEFVKWNKAGGKPVPGLTRRRKAEADLFNL